MIEFLEIRHKRGVMFGELIPQGGGDSIPLTKEKLLVGRRRSCDIHLDYPNVSSHHCELTLISGYWYVKDLDSSNGVKVNGTRVQEKRVDPGDTLSIAKHAYQLRYSPADNGAVGPPPPDTPDEDIFAKSLLERAGLQKGDFAKRDKREESQEEERFDLEDDSAGQLRRIKRRDKPT